MGRVHGVVVGVLVCSGCLSEVRPVEVQVAASALAIDETTVEIRFTEDLVPDSVELDRMRAFAMFDRPTTPLSVLDARVEGSTLLVTTAPQRGGALYALSLGELRFTGVEVADFPRQINFHGFGTTQVALRLDARGYIPPERIDALVTIDPGTGDYSERLQAVPLTESAPEVWTTTITARILPDRIFAARAVAGDGSQAAQLVTFQVEDDQPVSVTLTPTLEPVPEFTEPIDRTPGDGRAPIRIVFDDRFARELKSPALRASLDADGNFDLASTRVEPLAPVPGKGRVYETVLEVAVDPDRSLDGTTPDTFPYVVFLVEGGVDVAQRGATFVTPDETPQVIVVPMGNPALVPVTFRVDAADAFLDPEGTQRGLYAGEGVFLTGEFPSAEDALGRLAADAFTGGERATLEMKERPDAPGIYEKTIFLPPNRPYGWKVLRCPTGEGCAELNRHVVSSGRAFPTVMKNLVSENVDAAQSNDVQLIDPANLGVYQNARVSTDGNEAPSSAVMFKQEVPDLVVTVGTEPVITPIVVVGTWRDVNIPQTPDEIISSGGTLDLTAFDYDDGTQGRAPLTRDIDLPLDPGDAGTAPGVPVYDASDGRLDPPATEVLPAKLWVGWNEERLYVATQPASPGRDHFVVVAFDPPTTTRAAHWAKQGNITLGDRTVMLAMEGDGDFAGWFRLHASSDADELLADGVTSSKGTILEGLIDPNLAGVGGVGDRIWVAVLAYGTADGGALIEQSPAGNANLDVEASEMVEIDLATVR